MKMAFRRKDIKKAYYYVWFLGAKESKGLRGEQYILPVLKQLINIERRTEPTKVTIQVSSKGIKIIQNVPKKQSLPNGQQPNPHDKHPILQNGSKKPINQSNSQINPSSNTTANTSSSNSKTQQQNSTVKMEQIKHFIPHHAVTCALQSEDIVCIILLLYNPLTRCPVHVHCYQCDSIETAFTLKNQLQLLIDRPDNQRKFAEIESRLAAKGLLAANLISHQQLLNNNNNLNQNIIKQQLIKTNQITNGDNKYAAQQAHLQPQLNNGKNNSINQTQMIFTSAHDLSNRSKRNNTLTSDGRSAEDEFNQTEGYSPTIRSEPDGQPSLNKSLVESKSSSGNSSGSSGSPPPQAPNPIVIEMYENLAQELKAKLGNKQTGPLLLPPRDYDTVCRSQGKLLEHEKRACTNKLVVGKVKKNEKIVANKKPDNLVLDTKEIESKKSTTEVKDSKVDAKVNEVKVAEKNVDQSNMETLEMNKLKKLNKNEISEQERRLNHQQIREQQKQYELKLKNLQRNQEIYEQHQLLIEQQKQVRREFSQQHKPSKFVEEMANGKQISTKANSKEQIKIRNSIEEIQSSSPTSKSSNSNNNETTSVIHTGGIKQIGSNLANKIKQSLIGSNKEKLQPQLIYHKTIHDSLQSLNKLPNTDKYLNNKNMKSAKSSSNNKQPNAKEQPTNKDRMKAIINTNTASTGTSKSKLSNSSSNISNVLNEKLNTINNRSDSSSGIGSAANLANTSPNHKTDHHHDQLQYLSTDEELDDEILIDEYMPDYVYNQYLNNDEEDEEEDEIIDDLDDEEISNRVVRRFAIREKLLLLEKNKKAKCGSTGERTQISSEEDDSGNSIKYDENLGIIINTTKRIKKQTSSKPMKIDQKDNEIRNNAKNSSAKPTKISDCKSNELRNSISNSTAKTNSNQNLKASSIANQIKRSETYYDVSDQKKIFHHHNFYNNYPSRTNKSPNDGAPILQQPKLFYFPNPDFKAAQKLIDSQTSSTKQPQYQPQYHLGQQHQMIKQHCELKRQKSTPNVANVGGKLALNYHPLNYHHPILIDPNHRKSGAGSVEKLLHSNDEFHRKSMDGKFMPPNLVYQRGRPISMVNIQPEHFRIAHQDKIMDPMFNKRVPIYY